MKPSPDIILKQAVDEITGDIGQGQDPLASVVRVSRSRSLTPKFIKRACEVVNVALTYEHFRKQASPRDADFPLVDADQVIREVYAGEPASQKQAELSGGRVVQSMGEGLRRRHDSFAHRKVAAELHALAADVPYGPTAWKVAERPGNISRQLAREQEDALGALLDARRDLGIKFAGLVEHWCRDPADRTSFAAFETGVYAIHSDRAVPYLDKLYKQAGLMEPRGIHDSQSRFLPTDAAHRAFDDFMESVSGFKLARDRQAAAEAALNEFEAARLGVYQKVAELKRAGFQAHLESQRDALRDDQEEPANMEEDPVKQAAERATRLLPPINTLLPAPTPPEAKTKPAWAIPDDLQALDRKLMIQNLIVTDPLLRTYPAAEVLQAYRQYMRLAPELALEPAVTRAQLRAMMSSPNQALGPFEAKQLADAASAVRKYRAGDSGGDAKKPDAAQETLPTIKG